MSESVTRKKRNETEAKKRNEKMGECQVGELCHCRGRLERKPLRNKRNCEIVRGGTIFFFLLRFYNFFFFFFRGGTSFFLYVYDTLHE